MANPRVFDPGCWMPRPSPELKLIESLFEDRATKRVHDACVRLAPSVDDVLRTALREPCPLRQVERGLGRPQRDDDAPEFG